MAISASKIEKAYSIIENYDGTNLYVTYLKNCSDKGYRKLSEFDIKYILENHQYTAIKINKISKITEWFGEDFANKNGLDFIPEKLLIISVIGEMGDSLHCYVRYRQSVIEPLLTFIPKKALMDDIFVKNYKNTIIDFTPYNALTAHLNRSLKPHQEEAVKFLITRNKAILADEQGLGKTTSAIIASMVGNYKKILIICPASLKGTWKRELSYYTDSNNIGIIFGKEWTDNKKYTVINYDILDNFYSIPLEPDYKTEIIKDENGKEKKIQVPIMIKCKGKKGKNGETEPKMRKSRKKEIIKEALSKSQLFLSQFDLVIIDEVQKLANNTSIRYKTLDDFLYRAKPKAIYCITGTPLTNRPLNLYHILKLIDADVVQNYDYYMKRFCDAREINKSDGTKIKICDGASNLDELREKIKHLYIRRLQKDIPGMVNKSIFTRYYTLTESEMKEYSKLWMDYLNAQYISGVDVSKYQELIEGGLVRRYLADKMIKNTISLAEEHIEDGEKVLIVCCFENEVKKFKEHFGDSAVVYDGKKTNVQKDKAEYAFMNDPKKKVFIGQILASGVGITLTKSHICIFNSYSWVPSDNWQVMDRVHRLSQTEDVTVYYQLFDDDISFEMWDKVMAKEDIIKSVIKSENEK